MYIALCQLCQASFGYDPALVPYVTVRMEGNRKLDPPERRPICQICALEAITFAEGQGWTATPIPAGAYPDLEPGEPGGPTGKTVQERAG